MEKDRHTPSAYALLDSEWIYRGRAIHLKRDHIFLPDGGQTVREVVAHPGAAAILPIDSEGRIVLVRQYRHPCLAEILEIPAGTLEPGEDPYDCAMRELTEETGWIAGEMRLLIQFHPAVGYSTEKIAVYTAKYLTRGEQHLDTDEFIRVEAYTPDVVLRMIREGEITDAKTIIAVLCYIRGH